MVGLWNVVVAGNNSDTISIVQLDQTQLNEVTTESHINLIENYGVLTELGRAVRSHK